MKHNDWTAHAIWKIVELLPQKYIDGSYIENRIIKEDFTLEDINHSFYYAKDVLKSYIDCEWKTSGKTRHLSGGELRTISMLEECRVFDERYQIAALVFMAYLHDLDFILSKYLSAKVMGKFHRRQTTIINKWDKEDYGFWHAKSKKYLPLDDESLKEIEIGIKNMDSDDLERLFDSEDVTLFAKHVCYVIELAFGNKTFTSTDFTFEACEKALELLEEI